VVLLDFTGMTTAAPAGHRRRHDWRLVVTKLSPAITQTDLAQAPIPSIPLEAIAAFPDQTACGREGEMSGAPILLPDRKTGSYSPPAIPPTPKAWSLEDGTE